MFLPTSPPCTAAEDTMDIYLSPLSQGEELTSRSLDRLPKTRSMDNLVGAFENGVALTRTSSDPNLNKHCQEGRLSLESMMGQGGSFTENLEFSPDNRFSTEDQESVACDETPPSSESDQDSCVNNGPEPCLTTQPLPTLPRPLTLDPVSPLSQPMPIVCQTLLQITSPALPPITQEVQARTVNTTCTFTTTEDPPNAPISNGIEKEGSTAETLDFPSPAAAELLEIKKLTTHIHLEDSTETIKDEYGTMSDLHSVQKVNTGKGLISAQATNDEKWTQSVKKLLRTQSNSTNGGYRETPRSLSSPVQPGWMSAFKNTALCTSSFSSALGPSFRQIPPVAHCVDDDGLSVPLDAVQQRLRQIEASYKQEVEVLRRQVKQLQMKLESRQHSSPPSEPDIYYEDDITCLRESDDGDEEDSLSAHSEDRLSEGSWDRVDRKDTEVTRWVPDHMASHCFNCDNEFWIAKRRHHCRNCGNVYCKDCCHLKLPIPEQQLYDPVLVCNSCFDLLLESRTRELRSQQLKKPIATASS